MKGGSEPLTDDTMKQAALDWCYGQGEKDAVIAKYGEMKDWDTSQVTNMSYFFNGEGPDGGGNETFKVFSLLVENWDTSKVTDMSWMLGHAENFNGDLSKWDTSKVTNMASMFYHAYVFNNDISSFDTSSVINMS